LERDSQAGLRVLHLLDSERREIGRVIKHGVTFR
jgi:hypothetical protein